ncbi:hypothetical protein [Thalassotalea agarivorans]|uniref:hypothetical protein n=1 Tax=Thalassotalea agarivorans TaxID=349064 RepID=UPI00115F9CE5|nr:hypothetical protein [Thalassotalea agarivorans]
MTAPEGESTFVYLYNLLLLTLIAFLNRSFPSSLNKNVLVFSFVLLSAYAIRISTDSLFQFINLAIVVLVSILFVNLLRKQKSLIIASINIALLFNVSVFFIQFLVWVTFGSIIDFYGYIMPWEVVGYSVYEDIGLFRATGIHNEPGTYATVITILTFWYIILAPTKLVTPVLAMSTVALTSSGTGIVFSGLFFSLLFVNFLQNKKGVLKNIILISIICLLGYLVLFLTPIGEYLYWRFISGDVDHSSGTVGLKYDAMRFLVESTESRQLLGSGSFLNDCLYCKSINDTGLIFNIIFQLGLVGFVLLAYLIYKTITLQVFSIGLVVVVLLSKLPISSPVIIISLFILCFKKYEST